MHKTEIVKHEAKGGGRFKKPFLFYGIRPSGLNDWVGQNKKLTECLAAERDFGSKSGTGRGWRSKPRPLQR